MMLWEQWACCCVVIGKSMVTVWILSHQTTLRVISGFKFVHVLQVLSTPFSRAAPAEPWDHLGALQGPQAWPEGLTPAPTGQTSTHEMTRSTQHLSVCLSQQGSKELSWPGIEITGREQKDKWLTDACPAIPPGLWLKGQSTAICRIYIFLNAENAEYSVFQILGACPSGSSLYNLTATTTPVNSLSSYFWVWASLSPMTMFRSFSPTQI